MKTNFGSLGAWVLMPLLLFGQGPAGALSPAPIRFAPEQSYGPFVYQAADGQIRGLSVDILEELRPGLGVSIEVQPPQALAAILAAAQRGEVDLISSLRPTAERSVYLDFTSPYVEVPAVLVMRQSVSAARLKDLAGLPVAVGQGYAVESFVRQAHPDIRWQSVPDDLTALRGVLRGDFLAAVADIASVSHLIREHRLQGLQVGEAVGFAYPLSFAYRKELNAFGQQLQSALQRMDPGRRQQIMNRWIDTTALRFEDPRRVILRWLGLALVAVATVLLLFVHWRRRRAARP